MVRKKSHLDTRDISPAILNLAPSCVIIHFIHCNLVQISMLCYIGTSCHGTFHAGHPNMYISQNERFRKHLKCLYFHLNGNSSCSSLKKQISIFAPTVCKYFFQYSCLKHCVLAQELCGRWQHGFIMSSICISCVTAAVIIICQLLQVTSAFIQARRY